jgi:hypothetical protein
MGQDQKKDQAPAGRHFSKRSLFNSSTLQLEPLRVLRDLCVSQFCPFCLILSFVARARDIGHWTLAFGLVISPRFRAISAVVAQQLYTLWVGGSNPSSPTI